MRKILLLLAILLGLLAHEKLFVVEREESALAIIEDHRFKGEIPEMHNLNHGVVKFIEEDGYLITRDGYLIKFDPVKERKIKEVRASKSAIGFTLDRDFVAVANYADKTVEIYDRDLRHIQTIDTGSRNVGIKVYKRCGSKGYVVGDNLVRPCTTYLVFSLMDLDQIWVMKKELLKCIAPNGKPMFRFHKVHVVEDAGEMPFDAMLNGNLYIVGFFNSPTVGVLNLDTFDYRRLPLQLEKRRPVLKVPHFGFWSVTEDKFFIPAVGENRVFVFDRNFRLVKTIEVAGNPVFTVLSPDRKYIAVTFSGKEFPIVEIIDTESFRQIKRFDFGGMVLHVRWSSEEPLLYVSNNGNSEVVGVETKGWKPIFKVAVPKPSGLFIFRKP
ncbi:MAG: nitrite reductase [Epsilonproteobacteria bacterium]|nr:nitrite reductase [Campylobacterota bacterium]NPA56376.1 nitrite reductase [Campylobacterota bacterium]